ncbi:hypothetical protein N7505_000944 [Penicillium chrysogenum]|uniref:Uncharacterized protein n=1 Tax=Penicillium chrysogenum TaxID=5076 RepID=A0ABQ8WWF3_PENCH|nr:hypothetical protein N7505_000944 [Penicillium chrysogenum]
MPPFSKSGLQVLAGEYLAGPLLKWDEMSLFNQLFAAGSEPEMSVLTWELTELLCNMVIVVGAGSPQSYLLRVVLAPEFAWFGLHWAGMPHPGAHLLPRPPQPPPLPPPGRVCGPPPKPGRLRRMEVPRPPPVGSLRALQLLHPPRPAAARHHQHPPSPVQGDLDGVMPMEGTEFGPVSGVYMDTMIRDISPDMDVCAETGPVSVSAPPAPMTVPVPPSLPLVVPTLAVVVPSLPVVPPCLPVAAPSTNKYRQRY